jgi:hypothetical protein
MLDSSFPSPWKSTVNSWWSPHHLTHSEKLRHVLVGAEGIFYAYCCPSKGSAQLSHSTIPTGLGEAPIPTLWPLLKFLLKTDCYTWSDNKLRELIVVKVLHTSFLSITVVAFKVLPLGSYAPMPAPSPLFKTILQMVLWNGLHSCCHITPDVIDVIKMTSFQYFLYLQEQKSHWRLDTMHREGVPAQLFVY